MNISYNGYNTKYLTIYSEAVTLGSLVGFDANGNFVNAPSGKDFIGVAVSVHDGVVGVQESGYVEMPYENTIPTCGYCKLVSNGSNKVVVNSTAETKAYKVIKVDKENKIVGFML